MVQVASPIDVDMRVEIEAAAAVTQDKH